MWRCIRFTNQKDKLDSIWGVYFNDSIYIYYIKQYASYSCGNTSPSATTVLRTRTINWYNHYCVSADKLFQASVSGHLFSPTVYVKQFDQGPDRIQIQSALLTSDWAPNHKTSFHLGSWHLRYCMFVFPIILTNLTGVHTILWNHSSLLICTSFPNVVASSDSVGNGSL